jgi:N-acetylglutamate synthase-like GNAT family acetyltransferase
MPAPVFAITLLADRPDLAARWAELHWREWGDEPGREALSWWVADATKAVQRTRVPVAFLALGRHDEVLGGVGLHQFDLEERRDQSPWIVGMIVRADLRGEGIGQALMAYLEAWALGASIEQVWVATEQAAAFYCRCGFERVEDLPTQSGDAVTVLTKRFAPARRMPGRENVADGGGGN